MASFTFEKDFSRHPLHYFTLLTVELVGLWGIFWFSSSPAMQLVVLVSMSVAYVAWGVVHHWEHHDLRAKVVFEYVLMAALAILIFGSLLLNT